MSIRQRVLYDTIRVGFTGTQRGMTANQRANIRTLVQILLDNTSSVLEFHHGDCIGADEQFHEILRGFENPRIQIHIHPPKNSSKRAYCQGDVIYPEDDYIPRNHKIVDSVVGMLATPGEKHEVLRSGTWATIRYAKKRNIFIDILLP